jgi:hypothetical protein
MIRYHCSPDPNEVRQTRLRASIESVDPLKLIQKGEEYSGLPKQLSISKSHGNLTEQRMYLWIFEGYMTGGAEANVAGLAQAARASGLYGIGEVGTCPNDLPSFVG